MAFEGRWSYAVLAVRRLLTAVLALGTAVAAAADAPPSGPRLKFDAVEQNLGDVVRGQDAIATFTYRNVGDTPLKILSAKPG
jgi:hypothetical protein